MFVEILYRVRTCPKLLRWLAVLVLVVWLGTWHHSLHSSKQTYEGFTPLVREYIDQGSAVVEVRPLILLKISLR
jgi:hypothetical protein